MINLVKTICLTAVVVALGAGIPVRSAAEPLQESAPAEQPGKVTVSGTVLDQTSKEPLIGVAVLIKGLKNQGVVTDLDGKFTIELPYADAPLVFSYLGYQPKEIVPGNRDNITVFLAEDSEALREVVVVGYTTQRKETMIGSVATITTKELAQSPAANINNALAGRLAQQQRPAPGRRRPLADIVHSGDGLDKGGWGKFSRYTRQHFRAVDPQWKIPVPAEGQQSCLLLF